MSLVTSHEPAPWAMHFHIGYRSNRDVPGERNAFRHVSLAITRTFGKNLKLVADVGGDTNPDTASNEDLRFALLGFIYFPTGDFDFGGSRA